VLSIKLTIIDDRWFRKLLKKPNRVPTIDRKNMTMARLAAIMDHAMNVVICNYKLKQDLLFVKH